MIRVRLRGTSLSAPGLVAAAGALVGAAAAGAAGAVVGFAAAGAAGAVVGAAAGAAAGAVVGAAAGALGVGAAGWQAARRLTATPAELSFRKSRRLLRFRSMKHGSSLVAHGKT